MANPTKTSRIENTWKREINRRWGVVAHNIRNFDWETGQPKNVMAYRPLTINNAAAKRLVNVEPVPIDVARARQFIVFMEQQIDIVLMNSGNNWQAKYQATSYQRAVNQARARIMQQGGTIVPFASDVQAGQGLTQFTFSAEATLSTMSSLPAGGIHRDSLEFLFERSLESLDKWTTNLADEVRSITMEAVRTGANPRATEKKIFDRLSVSRSRARVIAQTETIQAYQYGNQNETERAAEELGEEILMGWINADDHKVRPLHREFGNSPPVSLDENKRRIAESPFNCRCAQRPVLDI